MNRPCPRPTSLKARVNVWWKHETRDIDDSEVKESKKCNAKSQTYKPHRHSSCQYIQCSIYQKLARRLYINEMRRKKESASTLSTDNLHLLLSREYILQHSK